MIELCKSPMPLTPKVFFQNMSQGLSAKSSEKWKWSWSVDDCNWISICHPIISCFITIENGSPFLVLAYPGGCRGREALVGVVYNTCASALRNVTSFTVSIHEWITNQANVE